MASAATGTQRHQSRSPALRAGIVQTATSATNHSPSPMRTTSNDRIGRVIGTTSRWGAGSPGLGSLTPPL